MKAEITMSQLWFNPSILGFFFTTQASETLSNLLDRCEDSELALDQIEDYANGRDIRFRIQTRHPAQGRPPEVR